MNSGVSPLLLPKNQLAFSTNSTTRGGFVSTRPAFYKMTLDYAGESLVQDLVENGFFQGAAYYRPDYGTESLIAQISGHILKFTENGAVWSVTDISIPNNINNPTVQQVWMFQGENYLIINDGINLPLFYDGTTIRRSQGVSKNVALTLDQFIVPAIGGHSTVNLVNPYIGPLNVRVIFNGEYYTILDSENSPGFFKAKLNVLEKNSDNVAVGEKIIATFDPVTTGGGTTGGNTVNQVPEKIINSPIPSQSLDSTILNENIVVANVETIVSIGTSAYIGPYNGIKGIGTVYETEVFYFTNQQIIDLNLVKSIKTKTLDFSFPIERVVPKSTPYSIFAGTEFQVDFAAAPLTPTFQVGQSITLNFEQSYTYVDKNGSSLKKNIKPANLQIVSVINGGQSLVLRFQNSIIGVKQWQYSGGEIIPIHQYSKLSDFPLATGTTAQDNYDIIINSGTAGTQYYSHSFDISYQGNIITIPTSGHFGQYYDGPYSYGQAIVRSQDRTHFNNNETYTSEPSSQINVTPFILSTGQTIPVPSYVNPVTQVPIVVTQQPDVQIGSIAEAFKITNDGNDITIKTVLPYYGPNGQKVKIGNSKFTISKLPPQSAVKSVTLKNITDPNVNSIVPSISQIQSISELPVGKMGAYGMGRIWMCLGDSISYMAGDIVGGGSGSPELNYRDAILCNTENTLLTNGGSFRLPVAGEKITSLSFPPSLDTSLGQGPLEIGTSTTIFSNNCPVDRTTWSTVVSPIQTQSLKGNGPLGQNSTTLVNSDLFFRSDIGIGSLVMARRDFSGWGNKPISNEMRRILDFDNKTLLQYGSSMFISNRYLSTVAPNVSYRGIFHIGIMSLNFDTITTLRDSLPPAWEGVWTGINSLQVVNGIVNNSNRSFSFSFSINQNKIELYELLPESTKIYADNGATPIQWVFETPVLFNKDIKPLTEAVQLRDGEIYLSDIRGEVNIKIYYRPDYYPCWTLWREFNICQSEDASNSQAGYRMRIGLGEPDAGPCEPGNNRPLRIGYFFQCRFEITGRCTWNGMRASSVPIPQPSFAVTECETLQCQVIDCDVPDDLTSYTLQGLPPKPQPAITPVTNFVNVSVYYPFVCPANSLFIFTGTYPGWIYYDSANQQLVGKNNVFSGTTQEDADKQAQDSLNSFVVSSVAAGAMYCSGTESASCAVGNVNQYKIDGYSSTMFQNPAPGGEPGLIWDGVFRYKQTAENCRWGGNTNAQFISIGGHSATCCEVLFLTNKWVFRIYYYGGSAGILMVDYQKLVGSNPEGTYTLFNQAAGTTQPATINVVPNGLTTTNVTLQGCS